MISPELIKEIAEKEIENSGIYVVESTVSPGNKIRIILDSDSSVSIDDCVKVSRHIEEQLNRDEEDFELEVTSFGLDMALKLKRQYIKRLGQEVDVITTTGKKYIGTLNSVSDDGIEVEYNELRKVEGKKRKELVNDLAHLLFSDIKETKVRVTF